MTLITGSITHGIQSSEELLHKDPSRVDSISDLGADMDVTTTLLFLATNLSNIPSSEES